MSQQSFKNFAFQPFLYDVIEKLKFKEPTPIQKEVIPYALKHQSLIGQSHTGSGKTHAYLLPLFNQIDKSQNHVQAVITVPTRELAMQIYDEVRKIIEFLSEEENIRAKLIIGGTDKQKMMDKLKQPPHIVVGTPGRILDLVMEGALDLYSASTMVIDEADLLIDLGLIEETDQILVRMPQNLQIMVFSATFPVQLQHFLKKYIENPKHITISGQGLVPEKMEHRLIPLRHREQADLMVEITKLIYPYLALIFVNKKEHADELANQLIQKGLDVGIIHGGLTPRERKRALKSIKNLQYQYIVATDLAARGIDIPGVSHIFNAELPKEAEDYIHRVGRTARAGLEGTAISFYSDEDASLIEKLEGKGIEFTHYDIKKNEWVEINEWNQRNKRERIENEELETEAWKRVRKKKKVKPGYKKKMKQEAEQIKKQLKNKQRQNKSNRKK
ncbi:ATP-dependent RNA helicase CshB [Salinibacillus kushneri]|uniref:ATP-dependent RNA helicase CshB n=1 Tax=Salinibacillus kushneri TaxID=237682 RepID=A0A1I0FYE2_9BACI|nr:DEAD/DEAH box helicase [Salinibacillus kushneri]SET63297.1 ATP-dependent RNA helicase CshB [Salinibacillus kushneri]